MGNIRVCHFISSLHPSAGGPAVAMAGLAEAQARAGLDVTVAATWVTVPGGEAITHMEAAGVKVRSVGPCRDPMSWHPKLAGIVDELVAGGDVAHIHALFESIQHHAARASQRRGVPYVIRPCGMLSPWSLSRSRWQKKLYMALRLRRNLDAAAALHFTAAEERDLTVPLRLAAPALVEPNGVDLREFEQLPPAGEFRSRYPVLTGKRVVLFLGRIHKQKGLDLLVPAFARASAADAVLVLAGPDDHGYGAVLRKAAEDQGVADRVLLVGPVYGADRVKALVDADLFVLPSYHENFGIACVEALAAGRPIIVSDQVNIHAEIMAAGVGGVVPLSVERLAAELTRWLADDDLRRAAAGRARPFVWGTYGWDQIARRWVGHYERLTGKIN